MNRRALLLGIAQWSGLSLAGCGGSGASTSSAPSGAALAVAVPALWDVSPWMWFIVGESRTIDLSLTLPAGVARGGTFALASGSAPLPPGFTLASGGQLVASNPTAGQTANVIFTYDEPSG